MNNIFKKQFLALASVMVVWLSGPAAHATGEDQVDVAAVQVAVVAAPAAGPRHQNMDMDNAASTGWGDQDGGNASCLEQTDKFLPMAENGVCRCCPKVGAMTLKCTKSYGETTSCMCNDSPCCCITCPTCGLAMATLLPCVDTVRTSAGDRSVWKRAAAGCTFEACLIGGCLLICLCP